LDWKYQSKQVILMAWTTISNLKGRLYIPDYGDIGKKHTCSDCFACQNCSDDRCAVCTSMQQETPPDPTGDAGRPTGDAG